MFGQCNKKVRYSDSVSVAPHWSQLGSLSCDGELEQTVRYGVLFSRWCLHVN